MTHPAENAGIGPASQQVDPKLEEVARAAGLSATETADLQEQIDATVDQALGNVERLTADPPWYTY